MRSQAIVFQQPKALALRALDLSDMGAKGVVGAEFAAGFLDC